VFPTAVRSSTDRTFSSAALGESRLKLLASVMLTFDSITTSAVQDALGLMRGSESDFFRPVYDLRHVRRLCEEIVIEQDDERAQDLVKLLSAIMCEKDDEIVFPVGSSSPQIFFYQELR